MEALRKDFDAWKIYKRYGRLPERVLSKGMDLGVISYRRGDEDNDARFNLRVPALAVLWQGAAERAAREITVLTRHLTHRSFASRAWPYMSHVSTRRRQYRPPKPRVQRLPHISPH
jgi:hypothetical protein